MSPQAIRRPLDINDVIRNNAVTQVVVRGERERRVRDWLGDKLLILAALAFGCPMEVEIIVKPPPARPWRMQSALHQRINEEQGR